MRTVLSLASLMAAVLAACANAPGSEAGEAHTLIVFAASSLTDAFTEIEAGFEAGNPGVNVMCSFASSRLLGTQIEAGAAADVFASANRHEMDELVSAGMVAGDAARIFLTNELVVILPASNPAGLETLPGLADPGIKLVLAAEDVPVGLYSREALESMNTKFGTDFRERVLANVVSNEDNVKQVVAKVQLGEADAGIVYTSDAVAAPDLKTLEIPPEVNVVAEYPIAVLLHSPQAELAQRFVQYVLSPSGQAVLQAWGFVPLD